ncbi:MAG: histidine kinase N-terminal 7TM domain-containing protein, partial [bacterium]
MWRARPEGEVNRWFAAFSISAAGWALGLAWCLSGLATELALRFAFASISLSPATFFTFAEYYPRREGRPLAKLNRVFLAFGVLFAFVSLFTPLIVYEAKLTAAGLVRKPGALYLPYAAYCLVAFGSALSLLVRKWSIATGPARVQLNYVLAGALLSLTGTLTTNLLLPLFTGRSTYSFVGPFFLLFFPLLVAHAIIRHRLMDLRLVIHRSLTVTTATLLSLLPVCFFLWLFGRQIAQQLHHHELIIL